MAKKKEQNDINNGRQSTTRKLKIERHEHKYIQVVVCGGFGGKC